MDTKVVVRIQYYLLEKESSLDIGLVWHSNVKDSASFASSLAQTINVMMHKNLILNIITNKLFYFFMLPIYNLNIFISVL